MKVDDVFNFNAVYEPDGDGGAGPGVATRLRVEPIVGHGHRAAVRRAPHPLQPNTRTVTTHHFIEYIAFTT